MSFLKTKKVIFLEKKRKVVYNRTMKTQLLSIIHEISFSIGLMGICIIMIGAARGIYHYLRSIRVQNFEKIRYEIGSHLILGLDFLVAKDVIDTLLINGNQDQRFWMDLVSLITVVFIRIILTYFIQKEIQNIRQK